MRYNMFTTVNKEEIQMHYKDHMLTGAEWNVMEFLWHHSPSTGREAIDHLSQCAGWSRSTTLTMLRRMTQKGLISCREEGGVNTYAPLVSKEDAEIRETNHFLNRVYQGSVSMMVNSFTKKNLLSQAEVDALMKILEEVKQND